QPKPVELGFGQLTSELRFALHQNVPNPFTGRTLIGFELPEASNEVSLTVYDASGRVLYRLQGAYEKGFNSIELDRAVLPETGVMYYRLETGAHTATKKMILLDR
ncbi:MAG: T9SS type A sorting domain-containing protein, partial [Saprospiraceae bacterium]|nr:T9SS type A sorting domain-containing protein [Saprospiraceae bacterium]